MITQCALQCVSESYIVAYTDHREYTTTTTDLKPRKARAWPKTKDRHAVYVHGELALLARVPYFWNSFRAVVAIADS